MCAVGCEPVWRQGDLPETRPTAACIVTGTSSTCALMGMCVQHPSSLAAAQTEESYYHPCCSRGFPCCHALFDALQRQGMLDADAACQRQATAAMLCLQTSVGCQSGLECPRLCCLLPVLAWVQHTTWQLSHLCRVQHHGKLMAKHMLILPADSVLPFSAVLRPRPAVRGQS